MVTEALPVLRFAREVEVGANMAAFLAGNLLDLNRRLAVLALVSSCHGVRSQAALVDVPMGTMLARLEMSSILLADLLRLVLDSRLQRHLGELEVDLAIVLRLLLALLPLLRGAWSRDVSLITE